MSIIETTSSMKRAIAKNSNVLAPNIMAGRKATKVQMFYKFM